MEKHSASVMALANAVYDAGIPLRLTFDINTPHATKYDITGRSATTPTTFLFSALKTGLYI